MATQEKGNNLVEKPILMDTLSKAGASRNRCYFVSAIDDTVAGAGVKTAGVLNQDAEAGESMTIMRTGVAIVKAGAAVTKGAEVESDATGRAIPLASGKNAGYAVTAAAQADDYMLVYVG